MPAPHLPSPRTTPAPPVEARPPVRLPIALVTAVFAVFPLNLHWSGPRSSYDVSTVVSLVDVGFAATLVTSAGPMWRRARAGRAGAATLLWVALAAVLTAAWFAHPSGRGAHTLLELWGTAALADALLEGLTDGFAGLIAAVVAGIAILEAVWSATQLIFGSALGLSRLSGSDPFHQFSRSVKAPTGSMTQIYLLAALSLVVAATLAAYVAEAHGPRAGLVVAAVAVVPVGFTFSRAALLGFVLLVGALLVGALRHDRRVRYAAAVVALCAGAAVPAAIWHAGWQLRSDQTTSAGSANALTTNRGSLVHQDLELVRSEPLTGVGPGRYVIALSAHLHQPIGTYLEPVHDVPLLAMAEGGPLAALVALALLGVAGWRATRGGPAALGLYLVYLPYFVFDALPYLYPQGLMITAVWLAMLDRLALADAR